MVNKSFTRLNLNPFNWFKFFTDSVRQKRNAERLVRQCENYQRVLSSLKAANTLPDQSDKANELETDARELAKHRATLDLKTRLDQHVT